MIHLSLVYWLLLSVPGYSILCRLDRRQLSSGLLGTLSLSYLATFVLLSPISIVCYLLNLPVGVFSVAIALLILAGLFDIIRSGRWRDVGKLIAAAVGIELLVLAANALLEARVGVFLRGDAYVHLARIRQLLDHGFTNADPFVAGDYFYSIYHTNLWHALYAAGTWLTGLDHLGFWHASLPLAGLLLTAGCGYLAWCVFEKRWAAWAAAMFFVGVQGTVDFLPYANKLAPYWLMPMVVAFAIQACRNPCDWRAGVRLGVASLVLGQVHGLYGLYAALLLGPLLTGVAVVKLIRRRADRWPQVFCVAMVLVSLPFPIVSKATSQTGGAARKGVDPTAHFDEMFIKLPGGLTVKDPLRGFGGGGGFRYALLAGGIIAALCTRRRRSAACASVIVLTGAAFLLFPPACSLLLAVVGRAWIVARLEFILFIGFVTLVPGTIAYVVHAWKDRWWLRALVSVAMLVAAPIYANPGAPWSAWRAHLAAASKPLAERRMSLEFYRAQRAALQAVVPPGQTILAAERPGMLMVMLHDCSLVAPESGSVGVPDLGPRRRDIATMLRDDVPWPERRALLVKYQVTYAFVPAMSAWADGHVWQVRDTPGGAILGLITADRPESVLRRLKRAVADDPENHVARLNLARLLHDMQKLDEALAAYRILCVQRPADPVAHYELGNLHLQRRQWKDALAAYDVAVNTAPAFADAHCNRGVTLALLGRSADAIEALRNAVEVNPRHVLGLYHLGRVLALEGQTQDAKRVLRRALEVDPNHEAVRAALQQLSQSP